MGRPATTTKRRRKESKRSRRQVRAKDVTARALELRRDGCTLAVIGEQLCVEGLTATGKPMSQEGVRQALERGLAAIAKVTEQTADELRTLTLARLDDYLSRLQPAIAKGKVAAVEAALKVEQSRAKLLGLNAPVQTRIAGPNGGPIETKVTSVSFDQIFESAMRAEPETTPGHEPLTPVRDNAEPSAPRSTASGDIE